MRRKMMVVVTAAVGMFALSSPATAGVHEGFSGSIGPGHLQFGATFSGQGDPQRVNRFEWSNVPANCFPISDDIKLVMNVDGDGRFHGKGPAENNSGSTVKISGRFKHHNKRAVGTFRMYGVAAGCSDLDTGVVDWEATKR